MSQRRIKTQGTLKDRKKQRKGKKNLPPLPVAGPSTPRPNSSALHGDIDASYSTGQKRPRTNPSDDGTNDRVKRRRKEDSNGNSHLTESGMVAVPSMIPRLRSKRKLANLSGKDYEMVVNAALGSGGYGVCAYLRETTARSSNRRSNRIHDEPDFALKIPLSKYNRAHVMDSEIYFFDLLEQSKVSAMNSEYAGRYIVNCRGRLGEGLLMERCLSDLHDFISSREFHIFRELEENQQELWRLIRLIAVQMLCALQNIHNCGGVWADLKAENVLISKSGKLRATDFGFFTTFNEMGNIANKASMVGTQTLLPPELFSSQDAPFKYSEATDLYAFGLLLCEVLGGNPFVPFTATDEEYEVRICSRKPPKFDFCDQWQRGWFHQTLNPIWDFLRKLLHPNPDQRYSNAKEAMEDEFFTSYRTLEEGVWAEEIDWDRVKKERIEVPDIMMDWVRRRRSEVVLVQKDYTKFEGDAEFLKYSPTSAKKLLKNFEMD